jgi:hypothetical protein
MKRVNEHTYEAYLLDYLEGTLHPSLREEMEVFLALHPGLLEEARETLEMRLSPQDVHYPDVSQLYREEEIPAEESWAPLFSAAADGSLSEEELRQVDTLVLEYPALEKELQAYRKTRLIPDGSVVYPDLESLKRSAPLILPVYRPWLRVAAAIALLAVSVWGVFRIQQDAVELPSGMASVDARVNTFSDRPIPGPEIPGLASSLQHDANPGKMSSPGKAVADGKHISAVLLAEANNTLAEVERQPLLVSLPALETDPASLRYEVITDRLPYSLYPSRSRANLMWLTSNPLLAANPDEEVLFRGGLLRPFVGNASREPRSSKREDRSQVTSLWRLADASLAAINLLTDNSIALNRDLDEDGRVVAYELSSDRFAIERKRRID